MDASLRQPEGLVVASQGNLLITDRLNRRVDAATGIITTFAGDGSFAFSGDGRTASRATLRSPQGLAVDSEDNVFIADTENNRIRRVDNESGVIRTYAGNGVSTFSGDGGAATSAGLNGPTGVAADGSGNLFIADSLNHRIRTVNLSTGDIITIAGDGTAGF